MSQLTDAEITLYQQQGYVVPEFRLPDERVDALRTTMEAVMAANPDIRPEQLVSAHIQDGGSEGVYGSRAFLDLAHDPDILDLVEAVIGPNIILWGCQIFCKPASDGMEVPMHQDGQYWPIRPLATCTVWLALDPSTPENGCLRVVSGSHQSRTLYPHFRDSRAALVLNQAVMPEHLNEADIVDVVLQPGQMSLHDVYMLHGSNPNRSTQRRAGIAIRYMPASSHFRRDLHPPRSAASGYTVDFSERPFMAGAGHRCLRQE